MTEAQRTANSLKKKMIVVEVMVELIRAHVAEHATASTHHLDELKIMSSELICLIGDQIKNASYSVAAIIRSNSDIATLLEVESVKYISARYKKPSFILVNWKRSS